MGKFSHEAREDAIDTVLFFREEIAEKILQDGEASSDLYNDYDDGDRYHHETHVDRDYRLLEAAQLIDELSEHLETDYGLWEGLEPRKAIACQAAFTYGNAVLAEWHRLIEMINFLPEILGVIDEWEELEYTEQVEKLGEYKTKISQIIADL